MKVRKYAAGLALLALIGVSLGGCVVYPSGYGYGYGGGYAPVYAAPVYVAPPPIFFGFGGGWRR